MNGTSGFQQDAQKGRSARPQQAKRRCVLCSVRGASERSENAAGGLFQHPARSAVFYLPITIVSRFLHEPRHQFGTGSERPLRTHDLIALSTGISTKRETVPDTVSIPHHVFHPGSSLLLAVISLLFSLPLSHAQVTQTPGAGGLNTQVNQVGNVYEITGGTTAGSNLFHSFDAFSVGAVETARFQTINLVPDAAVGNVLGRVTGGTPSNILGAINSATYYPNANLFLMNPNGFLFGPNATVNVGGMATFTTADYMRLTDSGRFNANPNTTPADLLTAAPVAAFGFLGSNPAAINFEGGQLTVAQGTGITLVGGDINLMPDLSDAPSGITAPGRPIRLTSVAGDGVVAADTGVPAAGMALGTITLGLGTVLSTAGDSSFVDGSGGSVSIRGGQFVANGAQILTGPAVGSMGQGGGVTIATTDSASFTNSSIDTSSFLAGGNAGAITVNGSQVSLQDTFLAARVDAFFGDGTTTGSGGAVTLTGTDSVSLTRSDIATYTFFSDGNGGAVTLMAPIVSLEESFITTGVFGDLITPFTASGGAVTLAGTTSVSLQRSTISTEAFETEGNAGAVTITAPTVTIVGWPDGSRSIITSTHSTSGDPKAGNGGEIEITGTNVTITDLARLESGTDSPDTSSRGGTIRITGSENILIDNGTLLVSTTSSKGTAGNMDLVGQHVTIRGESVLLSETAGPGSGGTIRITGGENIAIESASTISTNSAFAVDNQGPAGDIEFTTQQLTVTGGSRVSSSTFHNGAGGTITVQGINGPAQSVLIDDAGSGLFTDTQGSGAGGNITLNANTVTLQNGSTLSATTSGTETTATGGNITVQGSDIQLKTGVLVTAETFGSGAGGKVTISADQRITVADSFILTGAIPELGEGGAGGDIVLNAPILSLERSGLFASTSSTGKAGDVALQGQQITLVSDTVVATSTDGQGAAGTIKVEGLQGPGSRATSVALSNSRIESETVGNLGSEGHAGSIVMETARLTLTDSQLSTRSSFSQGSAGQLVVNASDQIQLVRSNITSSSEGGVTDAVTGDPLQTGDAGEIVMRAPHISIEDASTVTTRTEFSGQGGDINIVAGQSVTLNNGSSISASSSGAGNAGNILINAGQNYTSTDSTVTTQASQASGGNITVLATDTVHLTNSQLNASVQGSSTTVGGNITIDPQYVILQNSQILAQATQGQGGVIALTITNGGLFLPDATSTVSASSQFGVNGTVTIQSPNAPASGKIQPLGKTPLLPTSLLNQHCAALAGGEFSSFTVAGRDSLPTEPGSWLASPLATLNVGMGLGAKAEGVRPVAQGEELEGETAWLSLRQIAPAGFLTQAFALDWLTGCQS
jgi:filamentous hemagglutinin family protein